MSNEAEPTLFQKIIARQIPADVRHEDEQCIAFEDIDPQAPFHLLVVPKKPIVSLAHAEPTDEPLLGHLLTVAAKLAREAGHEDFRIAINTGAGAGQTVFHLHVHVLAGRDFN
jgi:histidine triad (HIT) family protein